MQRHHAFELMALSIAVGCGAAGDKPERALHVGDEAVDAGRAKTAPEVMPDNPPPAVMMLPNAASAGAPATRVGLAKLEIEIHDAAGTPLSAVALPCPSGCVDVEAVAMGGNPPYQYSWDDGSDQPKRQICAGSADMLGVGVTDTAQRTAEFGHDAERATTQLTVMMPACDMPKTADGGAMPPSMCQEDTTAVTCDLPGGIHLPEDVTVDIAGATECRFGKGAAFPASRYRLEYVTGCATLRDPSVCGWTVHGSRSMPGVESCFIVGGGNTILGLTPGTAGALIDSDPTIGGAFMTYDECVAANCSDPPVDFDFTGGTLGVQRDGGGVLGAIDDVGGEAVGGKSRTFRLSRLDACP